MSFLPLSPEHLHCRLLSWLLPQIMLFLFGEVTRGAADWDQDIELSPDVPCSLLCFCSFLNAHFLLSGASPPWLAAPL